MNTPQLHNARQPDRSFVSDYEHSIQELFEARAEQTPDAVAAEYGGARLTYRELNRKANQLAQVLRSWGVGPEVIVGVGLNRSLELPVALLGVLKAGGACMPLDPGYPAERLAYMQHDANAPVLITQPELEGTFRESKARLLPLSPGWSGFRTEVTENPASGVLPSNLAYVVYTSGSTGKPRGVQLTHRALVSYIVEAVKFYRLSPADRVLQFSSLSFDIAIEEMFPTWAAGGTVVIRDDDLSLAAADFLRFVERSRITVLDLPTAFWHELVHGAADLHMSFPASLRQVCVGGEKASAGTFELWRKITAGKVRWINSYGPSETSVVATVWEPAEGETFTDLPIGRPLPNTRVYVLDRELKPVPEGDTGELYIGGAGLARGYLNRPDVTAEKFIRDPFSTDPGARMYKTGDLARYRPDGNLEFKGRVDFQVKIRGFRIEVEEIEKALDAHPGLRNAAVLVKGETNKRLLAYFVPKNGAAPASSELRDFLKTSLPEYMIPAVFLPLKSLPLSPNGKVDRRALAEMEVELSDSGSTQARDETEGKLLNLWREVLGSPSLGIDDNFFESGGHSLLAIRLMHRIQVTFGKNLPLPALLEAPTVEKLAAILRSDEGARPWSPLVTMQPLGQRPPLFLVHGVGGHVLRFRALAGYLAPDQPLYALQAQGLDGQHPPLRKVEDMADRYLEEIRNTQREGPYYLAGYSFGGFVALEMARRLTAAGQEVRYLALVDTFAGKPASKASLLSRFVRLSAREQVEYLTRKIRKKIKRAAQGVRLPADLQLVRRCCYEAESAFQPVVYSGKITLFRPTLQSLRGADDGDGGWQQFAQGGVDVHEIPGDHGSIIDEPNVRLLAQQILTSMDRAGNPRPLATATFELKGTTW